MENLVQLILDTYYEEKRTGEMIQQLNKVALLEEKFLKGFSKEKWNEYFDLDIEIGCFHILEVEQVIRTAIKVLKEIYK